MEVIQHGLNFLEITKWVMGQGEKVMLIKFLMVAWGLWGRRNKKMYEEQHTSPKFAIEQSLAILSVYTDCLHAPK